MITESDYIASTELSHRKKYAQFFTPESIADFMARWVLEGGNVKSVLEPAFGLGIFTRSMLKTSTKIDVTAYDIDEHIIDEAKSNMALPHVSIINQDYITSSWEDSYDAIICNPPYLKFHDYDNNRLVPIVNQRLGSSLSRFTNLYPLFLMKSLTQLKRGGRCAYIIPSEFLNADYGVEVKRFLLGQDMQMHFIIIDFEENVFDGAITTACIVLCENLPNDGNIRFSTVRNTYELQEALGSFRQVPKGSIHADVKWKSYYNEGNSIKYKYLIDFSTYAKVSRGIATGANKYYTFTKDKARRYDIPQEALLRCVCHSVDIDKTIFTTEDFERLEDENKSLYLFNGVGHEECQSVSDYISLGEREGVKERYLCQGRKPWYSLEKRAPAPIWVSVFNRKGLKFVRNEAMIANLTTFHCLYVNSFFVDADILFAYLLTDMACQIFLDNSRQYGNGLVKFEPNDLNKAKVVDLGQLSEREKEDIKRLYHAYRAGEDRRYIDAIEDILMGVYANA